MSDMKLRFEALYRGYSLKSQVVCNLRPVLTMIFSFATRHRNEILCIIHRVQLQPSLHQTIKLSTPLRPEYRISTSTSCTIFIGRAKNLTDRKDDVGRLMLPDLQPYRGCSCVITNICTKLQFRLQRRYTQPYALSVAVLHDRATYSIYGPFPSLAASWFMSLSPMHFKKMIVLFQL